MKKYEEKIWKWTTGSKRKGNEKAWRTWFRVSLCSPNCHTRFVIWFTRVSIWTVCIVFHISLSCKPCRSPFFFSFSARYCLFEEDAFRNSGQLVRTVGQFYIQYTQRHVSQVSASSSSSISSNGDTASHLDLFSSIHFSILSWIPPLPLDSIPSCQHISQRRDATKSAAESASPA